MPAVPGRRESGGRYGLLLLVLIGTYLFSAFSGAHLTTEVQIGLFALVLLLAMRTSPLPGRWPLVISALTVTGSAGAFAAALTGTPAGEGAAELWKALVLLMTAVVVVRRVLAKPTVTIQSIYGALSAYLIVGLMFAACYAAIQRVDSEAVLCRQPARQHPDAPVLQLHHADHPGVRGLHRGQERRPVHRGDGGHGRPGIPGHPGGQARLRVPRPTPRTRPENADGPDDDEDRG